MRRKNAEKVRSWAVLSLTKCQVCRCRRSEVRATEDGETRQVSETCHSARTLRIHRYGSPMHSKQRGNFAGSTSRFGVEGSGMYGNSVADMSLHSATPHLRAVHLDRQSDLQCHNAPCPAEAGFENRIEADGDEVTRECFPVTTEPTLA
jgi:hypothetical protein